jgi:CMP-N,N'-diacetyllegionaminic acid synthase
VIDGRRVLAVCPARGGSKGIPLKNLEPFLGVPLVARVGHLVRALPEIDRAVVSTDHPRIAEVAREAGLDAPFVRPEALSGDRVADAEVLIHALDETERRDGVAYDVVLMLQPTSPLRTADDVRRTLAMLVRDGWDAVWTVSETDSKHHPWKQLAISGGGLDHYDRRGEAIVARQELPPIHHRNGVAYAVTRSCLVERRTLKGPRTGALVLDGVHVSIDTRFDLALAELVASRGTA